MAGFFAKLKEGLTKTRENFVGKIEEILTGRKKIDEELYEELEEVLIRSDVGVNTSIELVERLRKEVRTRKISLPSELTLVLQELIADLLGEEEALNLAEYGPSIILVVGVNSFPPPTRRRSRRWPRKCWTSPNTSRSRPTPPPLTKPLTPVLISTLANGTSSQVRS